jgi:hypothetical protein
MIQLRMNFGPVHWLLNPWFEQITKGRWARKMPENVSIAIWLDTNWCKLKRLQGLSMIDRSEWVWSGRLAYVITILAYVISQGCRHGWVSRVSNHRYPMRSVELLLRRSVLAFSYSHSPHLTSNGRSAVVSRSTGSFAVRRKPLTKAFRDGRPRVTGRKGEGLGCKHSFRHNLHIGINFRRIHSMCRIRPSAWV